MSRLSRERDTAILLDARETSLDIQSWRKSVVRKSFFFFLLLLLLLLLLPFFASNKIPRELDP